MVICSKLKYNIHEVLDFFYSFYENTLYEYIAEGDGAKFYVLTQCNCAREVVVNHPPSIQFISNSIY